MSGLYHFCEAKVSVLRLEPISAKCAAQFKFAGSSIDDLRCDSRTMLSLFEKIPDAGYDRTFTKKLER